MCVREECRNDWKGMQSMLMSPQFPISGPSLSFPQMLGGVAAEGLQIKDCQLE